MSHGRQKVILHFTIGTFPSRYGPPSYSWFWAETCRLFPIWWVIRCFFDTASAIWANHWTIHWVTIRTRPMWLRFVFNDFDLRTLFSHLPSPRFINAIFGSDIWLKKDWDFRLAGKVPEVSVTISFFMRCLRFNCFYKWFLRQCHSVYLFIIPLFQ